MKDKLFKFINKYSKIDYDIFSFSYNIFKMYFFTFIIILIISIRLNIVLGEIIFWFFYIPLRRYSGGFHFNSKIICMITSILFSIIISLTIKFPIISLNWRIVVILFSIIVVFCLGTANHPNKKLSIREIKIYTKKAFKVIIIYAILLLIPINLFECLLNILTVTLLFSSFNLIFAKLLKQG